MPNDLPPWSAVYQQSRRWMEAGGFKALASDLRTLPRMAARQGWARLRVAGVRTSRRRTLRLMRENDLLAPSWAGAPKGPLNHDGTIIPDAIDVMWGTALFIAIDHYSGERAGIHAARRGTRFEALEPIRQGVRRCFGAFAEKVAVGLSLRHDHGSPYMSDDFQNEIRFPGIESSPAFVRAPEGNGCAERLIRTLEENLPWVRTFETVEKFRQALLESRDLYNETWRLERHGFLSPNAIRARALSTAVLAL